MAVTDQEVATLRAQLAGDAAEHTRLFAELDPTAVRSHYSALVSAAFCTAVERRFATNGSTQEVIKFVGEVRSRFDEVADDIDPRTAERLIMPVYTVPFIVTAHTLGTYRPREMEWWEFLDVIEDAIERAWAMDLDVLPALMLRSRMPTPAAP